VIRHADPAVSSSSSSSGSGGSCSALDETQRCDSVAACASYSLRWGDWGHCQTYRRAVCGPGRRRRHYDCIRDDDGLVVSRTFCADNVRLRSVLSLSAVRVSE